MNQIGVDIAGMKMARGGPDHEVMFQQDTVMLSGMMTSEGRSR